MPRQTSSLDVYQQKRDFTRTAEPGAQVARAPRTGCGSRFVVQKHDARRLHFDLRLELDGVLKSWAVTRGPSLDPSDKRLAVRTEDHPIPYEGFEGTIPKGEYGGGTVMLWDQGTWVPRGDPHQGLEKGILKFELVGQRLKGGFALVRLGKKPRDMRENWLLIKERDAFAERDGNVAERWWSSIATGRTMEGIAVEGDSDARQARRGRRAPRRGRDRGGDSTGESGDGEPERARSSARLPAFVAPQLARLVEKPPLGSDWVHEIKYDGYRAIAAVDGGVVRIFTRSGLDWTVRFAGIARALATLRLRSALLDGEIVVADEKGRSSFGLLQAALKTGRGQLVYYVFDILAEKGRDLTGEPLVRRKARLETLISSAPRDILFSQHVTGHGDKVLAQACRMGLEGIVSKRADARYVAGRAPSWRKAKCLGRDEFVVAGYRRTNKRSRPFSSLILAEYVGDTLTYRGRVGTGFDDAELARLGEQLARLERKQPAVDQVPRDVARDARWVEPRLVAEIAYMERTADGVLRHPTYLGLRYDKAPQDVKMVNAPPPQAALARESSGPITLDGVRVTNPGRMLFAEAGLSKLDLATYLLAASDRLLAHVAGRPLSFVRCPEGSKRGCFFQKHHTRGMPEELSEVRVVENDGKEACYVGIDTRQGLVAAAQIGALELHVWGARADQIDRPDRLVLDLDPDESLPFAIVRRAAFDVRDVLAAAGLQSFAMLTGGKGVHVVAPVERRHEWDEVKSFSHGLALRLARDDPGRFVATMSKRRRKGRIFIDYLRNERGSTAIAPYSARAKPHASVAMPVSWEELRRLERADHFTITSALPRIEGGEDPWAGYFDVRQRISAAAKRFFAA